MIELTSSSWAILTHAYGAADDVPDLLERLRDGDDEALDSLYGSICHQGSVYPASLAAVPHLVQAAESAADPEFRAQILALVGAISARRNDCDLSKLSREILDGFHAWLPGALELTLGTLREVKEVTAIHLLEAAAALNGMLGPGQILSGFASEEFAPTCSLCDRQLYVWPADGCLKVTSEDPVSHPNTEWTTVVPGPVPRSLEATYRWIRDVASVPTLSAVRPLLAYLYGLVECPACGGSFSLMERLEEELPHGRAN